MSGGPRPVHPPKRTMHGSKAEWKLAAGLGRLIRQDGSKVPPTGDKPGNRQRRRP